MPRRKYYDVFIAVHEGEPLDWQKYRHTALFFSPVGGGGTFYSHIVGALGDFVYETRTNYDVLSSRTLIKLIPVGKTQVALTTEELRNLLRSTVVENDNIEFNCQLWVDRTLTGMAAAGYLTAEECDNGLDNMMTVTMDGAEDMI